MAKSRNRSRDAKKRAAKKRKNRDYQALKLAEIAAESTRLMDLGEELRKRDGTR
jgi:hypothetical protein